MRLIDADALTDRIEADKKQDNISPGNFFLFKAYIMNAPTIEPDGDTISRRAAILAITGEPPEAHYPSWYAERIKALPSAETHDKRTETHGVRSDLISRGDAVALVIKAIHGTDNKEIKEYLFDGLRKQMWSLPSAKGGDAEMNEVIPQSPYMQQSPDDGADLISRQAVLDAINGTFWSGIEKAIKNIPSAPDSRQRGEWVYHKNTMSCVRWSKWECSACHKKQEYKTNYCPSCGADMRGEEE